MEMQTLTQIEDLNLDERSQGSILQDASFITKYFYILVTYYLMVMILMLQILKYSTRKF